LSTRGEKEEKKEPSKIGTRGRGRGSPSSTKLRYSLHKGAARGEGKKKERGAFGFGTAGGRIFPLAEP